MADDPKGAVRRFYDAMNSRDIDAVLACYAYGAVLDVIAEGKWGGEQTPSRDVLEGFYATFPEIEFTLGGMVAEGDRVAVDLSSEGATKGGKPYCNRYHNYFEIRDGKIAYFREFPTNVAKPVTAD